MRLTWTRNTLQVWRFRKRLRAYVTLNTMWKNFTILFSSNGTVFLNRQYWIFCTAYSSSEQYYILHRYSSFVFLCGCSLVLMVSVWKEGYPVEKDVGQRRGQWAQVCFHNAHTIITCHSYCSIPLIAWVAFCPVMKTECFQNGMNVNGDIWPRRARGFKTHMPAIRKHILNVKFHFMLYPIWNSISYLFTYSYFKKGWRTWFELIQILLYVRSCSFRLLHHSIHYQWPGQDYSVWTPARGDVLYC